MTANGWLQIVVFALSVLALTMPLGWYLVRVYDGSVTWLRPLEQLIYRVAGIDAGEDQHWTHYAIALLMFSGVSMLLTYAVLRLQHLLPLDPARLPAVPARQAFETSASFTTNTDWQSYSGESTMSYLSQMTQLTFHNFASAATGVALAMALVRGIARRGADALGHLGNFWVDLVRGTLYVFLPFSIVLALLFVQQGAIQNVHPPVSLATLEGGHQTLAMGPVASQEAIKQIGTNGGGFFNANAAHPFENPTPWTDFLSMLAIFAIPSAIVYAFGLLVGSRGHAWTIWSVMALLFAAGTATAYVAEARGIPAHAARGLDVAGHVAGDPGGNMEGKEVRFGVAASVLYTTVTTDASCGAVNAMFDSLTPLGGLVPLANIELGEVIFGGVGVGLSGMLIMVVLTVFIAGLMVGRTPEYLGKRIQRREVQAAMLYILIFPATILILSAVSSVLPAGLAGRANLGPHGLSEILYAFSSTTGNNGSAYSGLTTSTTYYNSVLGVAMLIGRFAMIVPTLALAGFLAERNVAAATAGTFPVTGPLFALLLLGVVFIVGALTFFPVLSLGPVVEQLQMLHGVLY